MATEDVTTAILREISQDSDSPDSDSGSEIDGARDQEPARQSQRTILKFHSNYTNFYQEF